MSASEGQTTPTATLRNRSFAEIRIGDCASLTRRLSRTDIKSFALISGDLNPTHVDDQYALTHGDGRLVAHNMWAGALISSVLGNELPGPGTVYLGQSLKFMALALEDPLAASVGVLEAVSLSVARTVGSSVARALRERCGASVTVPVPPPPPPPPPAPPA